jgi:hypothetical protein
MCSFYTHCLLAKSACTADQMENCGLAAHGELVCNCTICGKKATICRSANDTSRPCVDCDRDFVGPRQQMMREGYDMPQIVTLDNGSNFAITGKCVFPGCKHVMGQLIKSDEEIDTTLNSNEIPGWEKISHKIPSTVCKDCQPVKKVEKVKLPKIGPPVAIQTGFTRG